MAFLGKVTDTNKYFLRFNLALQIKKKIKTIHIFCNLSQQQEKMHTLRVFLKLNLMCLGIKSYQTTTNKNAMRKKRIMFSRQPETGKKELIVKTNYIYRSINQFKPSIQKYVLLFNIYSSLHNSRFN